MGFIPLAYWGNNTGTINPVGIVFYHTPTSFTGTGQWLDVSGNGNHAYVSGAAMGNDSIGWQFSTSNYSNLSNYFSWPSTLVAQPSSSFTLQFYGNANGLTSPGNSIFRTANPNQDLSGSGWLTNYLAGYMDILRTSGSAILSGGGIFGVVNNSPRVYTILFTSG